MVLLDPNLVGLHVRVFTYVTLARHGGEEGLEFERDVAAFPEVLDRYAVTGESDYILHIVAPSLAEFSESVLKKLIRLRGVDQVRSNIVLDRIKSTTQLPLGQIGRKQGPARLVRLVERINQEGSQDELIQGAGSQRRCGARPTTGSHAFATPKTVADFYRTPTTACA